jgi:hypothetical protein
MHSGMEELIIFIKGQNILETLYFVDATIWFINFVTS